MTARVYSKSMRWGQYSNKVAAVPAQVPGTYLLPLWRAVLARRFQGWTKLPALQPTGSSEVKRYPHFPGSSVSSIRSTDTMKAMPTKGIAVHNKKKSYELCIWKINVTTRNCIFWVTIVYGCQVRGFVGTSRISWDFVPWSLSSLQLNT